MFFFRLLGYGFNHLFADTFHLDSQLCHIGLSSDRSLNAICTCKSTNSVETINKSNYESVYSVRFLKKNQENMMLNLFFFLFNDA